MKVPAVNFNNMTSYKYKLAKPRTNETSHDEKREQINDLTNLPYIYSIHFCSHEKTSGQSKLRKLFAYGLPCMYSGVIMIDPKELSRWLNSGLQDKPAPEVLKALEPYKDSFGGMEGKTLELIRERAEIHPDKNIKEILEEVEPIYKRKLRKVQAPIFHELQDLAENLPEGYKYNFENLMVETNNKLNERPVIIPFSSYEFKYRLYKINNYIQNGNNAKAKKVMNKLIKESQRFSSKTNPQTIDQQQRVLKFIDVIVKKSVLKDDPRLNELIEVSKSRLMREEIIVPFSRKQFLYDLIKIIDDLPDKELRDKMMSTAEKLPTSNEEFSAYIVKIASDPTDKILHRLVWGYLASVEHLKPKSEGGDRNNMANLGAARTVLNSERKSRDFTLWMEEHPEIRQNCQKYVDRLIELYQQGVFKKHDIDPKYILEFKNTIYELSNHALDLDTSKLYN